jgi:hypothetical protein
MEKPINWNNTQQLSQTSSNSASFEQGRQTQATHRLERIDSILARSIKMYQVRDISKQAPEAEGVKS